MPRLAGSRRVTSFPAIRICPVSGQSNPAINRKQVDFPQPDGPSKTVNWPRSTFSETPLNAGTPSKCLVAWMIWIDDKGRYFQQGEKRHQFERRFCQHVGQFCESHMTNFFQAIHMGKKGCKGVSAALFLFSVVKVFGLQKRLLSRPLRGSLFAQPIEPNYPRWFASLSRHYCRGKSTKGSSIPSG